MATSGRCHRRRSSHHTLRHRAAVSHVRGLVMARLVVMSLAVLLLATGCRRNFYRRQADNDAVNLIQQKAPGPSWPMPDVRVYAPPDSRMFDPTNPDRPAMPPDDPLSHELMHYVDGKRGYPRWHQNGDIPYVDANCWRRYLPYDEQGRVVLNRDAAVQLALVNSRAYQTEIEDLYLSALDVSFERFRFDAQFFGGNSTFFTADGRNRPGSGGESSSVLQTDTGLQVQKLNAFGGEAVVGLANSFIWQFSGNNSENAFTILDFSLIQPLLRFGGRARVLEQLTLSERTLLANVRQFEQYRQGFYTEVVIGHTPGDGTARRPGIGGVGSAGFGITGTPGGGNVGGFFGLLQTQQQIRNQIFNVTGLRDSVALLRALQEGGRIQTLQVEQARQALNGAQSRLLIAKAGYEQRLDTYKVQLGLPPDVEMKIEDPYLDRFKLIDDPINELQDDVDSLVENVRGLRDESARKPLEEIYQKLLVMRPQIEAEHAIAKRDYNALLPTLDTRRRQLAALLKRPEVLDRELDADTFRPEELDRRIERLRRNLERIDTDLLATWTALGVLEKSLKDDTLDNKPVEMEKLRGQFENRMNELYGLLLEISLSQAGARLESVTLTPVTLQSPQALEIARHNRRDWMNARAALVDSWRRIEFDANALKSGLNVVLNGDVRTVNDHPFDFRRSTGRLRVGVQFDAPLTRLVERNDYRETLIAYQRSRRNYMLFEDRINQSLRNILRIIHMFEMNFEMSRAGVIVAVKQVDLARERLNEPQKTTTSSPPSPTLARDSVSALSDLLNAQNDFLNVWVNYEALRMSLDLELGTMQLDPRGIWIDPGPIDASWGVQPEDGEDVPDFEIPPELLPQAPLPAGQDLPSPKP